MSKALPKCSECGCSPCSYRELATTAIRFDLTNNKFDEAGQYMHPNKTGVQHTGFNYHFEEKAIEIESELEQPERSGKVEAQCSCGHIWILRNFSTIDALIDLHGFNKGKKYEVWMPSMRFTSKCVG
ncbi:hypothetical protein L3081_25085 [Colwellia sp. MSW7]|uniref:Uncharacterized protein n=1 Tax=Colwellia maritima TaxID=2912588 RepID=A0ABS9X786_9GAMM|nr:hypothetical protein [Colwellia maritima]MCI2286100.1 hypothetical protein [Colwellia maritima]